MAQETTQMLHKNKILGHDIRQDYANVLLTAGVDPDRYNADLSLFPLHLACRERDLGSLDLLLKHGAQPGPVLPSNGRSPLHVCAENGFRGTTSSLFYHFVC